MVETNHENDLVEAQEVNEYPGVNADVNVTSTLESPDGDQLENSNNSNANTTNTMIDESEDESDDSDDSDDESEDDDSEKSDSDEETEPPFNYSRITKLPKTFFHKDAVSSAYTSDEVFVFATHSGVVHLARPDFSTIRTTRVHRASVVDIDSDGTFVATASIDGTVVISSIEDPQDVSASNFKRPVHSVALDPNYAATRAYVSGGTAGLVTLSEKGWLKSRADTTLYQANSTIVALKWIDTKIIWFNEDGITIYDTVSSSIVQRISRLPNSPRADLYRPRIFLQRGNQSFNGGADILVVGWASTVWIINLNTLKVETSLRLEWLISGITLVSEDTFILLCVQIGQPPELRVYNFIEGVEKHVDELSLEGYKTLAPNDYTMTGDETLYIISAKDSVIVKPRDQYDHMNWLLNGSKFVQAYEYNKSLGKIFDRGTRKNFALKIMSGLTSNGEWYKGAELLAEALDGSDRAQWVFWSNKFLGAGQFKALGDHIPTENFDDVHTRILLWAISNDHSLLIKYLGEWPADIIDTKAVVEKLEPRHETDLRRALAQLYLSLSDPVNATSSYLEINSGEAFKIVEHYHLWEEFLDHLPEVLKSGDIDDDTLGRRIQVLVENRSQVTPDTVVAKLKGNHDRILFLYLQRINAVDEFLVKDYSDLLIRLYAEYDRSLLLSFLTRNDTYSLDDAIAVSESKGYTNELVYLFGKVGRSQKALDLIVNDLQDSKRAVEFATAQNDNDLWDYLIEYSKDKPEFVLQLLHCPQVRPARVLEIVPHTLEIPGLRNALRDVLLEQGSILALNNGALSIVKSEAKGYLHRLQAAKHLGYGVDPEISDNDWANPTLITLDEVINLKNIADEMPAQSTEDGWFKIKIHRLGFALHKLGLL